MSVTTENPQTGSVPDPNEQDGQPVIDMSGMNKGQQAAMEVAESARDQGSGRDGFASRLFMGGFEPGMIVPFPAQSPEDRKTGDEMVQRVSAYLAEHLNADEVDETREIPSDVIKGLTDMGVFRMKVPTQYGGMGFSQVNYNRVMMAISSYCGSTAVQVSAHQSIGVPQPLKMFGTDEQKAKYLPMISEGALTAFALTEIDVGSDPAQMNTNAVLSEDGSEYILNGTKLWTTNGPIADLLVVMAQTAPKIVRGKERKQISAFIVEADSPGVKVAHRCDFMGLRAIHNGVIKFHDVKVPAENLVWGEGLGLKLALKTLNTGRLTLPAACTGMAKQCLAIVRRWGNERVQWGLPVGKHEAGQEKIGYIAATTFAMEAVTWLTSHWADEDKDIRIEAAMAKLFCSEAAWRIVDITMQFRGGRGYERAKSLEERGEAGFPVERMMRDCRINTIIEGTSDIMRLFLAREALDPHLRRASDMIRPGTPLGKKAKAFSGLAAFYGAWYPRQCWGRFFGMSSPELRPFVRWSGYIGRASHRLAGSLFQAMMKHQQKLERRQVLLGHFMEIGTELFAMTAACAYSQRLEQDGELNGAGGSSRQLAELFCTQARHRVDEHFRAARRGGGKAERALVKRVLAGDLRWLETHAIHPWPED